MTTDPKYPIGKYELKPYSEATKKEWINALRHLPTDVEMAVLNLDQVHLETPYRDGGWTVQQLVHHIADSHMNKDIFQIGLLHFFYFFKSTFYQLIYQLIRRIDTNYFTTIYNRNSIT